MSDTQVDEVLSRPKAVPSASSVAERLGSLTLDKKNMYVAQRSSSWGRWLFVLLAIFGVSTALYGISRRTDLFSNIGVSQSLAKIGEKTEIEAIPVRKVRASQSAELSISGYIAARTKIQLSSKIPGSIVELPIEEGMKIKPGDLIARLESDQYEADLKQAQAALALAKARYAQLKAGARDEELDQLRALLEQAESRKQLTEKELARAQTLKGSISAAEFDRTASAARDAASSAKQASLALQLLQRGARVEEMDAGQAEVDRAQAVVDKAQYFVDNTRVIAGAKGTILRKSVELGEYVRIDPMMASAALCEIADLDDLQAEVDVQERDLVKITIGRPCRITPEAYPDRSYVGRVERRSPVANRQRGVIQVKVKILKPDDELLPDMNCKVDFLADTSAPDSDTLEIPQRVVSVSGQESIVFVLEDDVARKRPVRVSGGSQPGMVAVVSGLTENDVVLSARSGSITEGQRVHVSSAGKGSQ